MSDTIIIEIDDEPIGLGQRTRGGVRFFASARAVRSLDHQVFRSIHGIERAARALMTQERRAA
ncbi:hypothetical protein [Phreatobacter sp. AB_2022a]|uniref:hypothetical protein n=1 Tax=Phreatobacter sp. AB_2022a TaxID=3003134 RepID=UPI0022873511|nr:hypothetical protein [Phreatobacter sp. AB_2022a]MCZ0734437.1 hypothetical protein [Phreatobacter sp. AB_2022a]